MRTDRRRRAAIIRVCFKNSHNRLPQFLQGSTASACGLDRITAVVGERVCKQSQRHNRAKNYTANSVSDRQPGGTPCVSQQNTHWRLLPESVSTVLVLCSEGRRRFRRLLPFCSPRTVISFPIPFPPQFSPPQTSPSRPHVFLRIMLSMHNP